MIRFGSVCSGIEAASQAWIPLGWDPVFYSEIDRFPSAVLAHHHPHVPNFGDMNAFKSWPDAVFDLLVGGTPCQSFSIAGLRAGLDDPRGNLALVYLAIAARYRPFWLAWENVPGALSVDEGAAFASIIGGMAELGYGYAWRVFDAQYFGLAQRRARLFLVGCLGGWSRAAAVLFEPESLRWDPAPSREARENIAGTLAASSSRRGGTGSGDGSGLIARTLRGEGFDASDDGTRSTLIAGTLQASGKAAGSATQQDAESGLLVPLAFGGNDSRGSIDLATTLLSHNSARLNFDSDTFLCFDSKASGRSGFGVSSDVTSTLRAMNSTKHHPNSGGQLAIANRFGVRRLTPRECERLMGFPDDFTLIPYHGSKRRPAKDGPRYKALGNSMPVTVMEWLGQRIAEMHQWRG